MTWPAHIRSMKVNTLSGLARTCEQKMPTLVLGKQESRAVYSVARMIAVAKPTARTQHQRCRQV